MSGRIKGLRCPSCQGETLAVASGDMLICTVIGCKNPSAINEPPPPAPPIPLILNCPECGTRHIDVGEFATKPHHTHACQNCGMVWRPGVVPTVGVQFLPGFKNV